MDLFVCKTRGCICNILGSSLAVKASRNAAMSSGSLHLCLMSLWTAAFVILYANDLFLFFI